MDANMTLPRKWLRIFSGYLRLLWVRVTAMGLLAVLAIASSSVIERLLPAEMQTLVGGTSADRLLNLIASAMLTVTTFSLTVMVSTYQATSSQFTPRIHQLIREDAITQNTLATFIGTYVYALTAIVLREVGFFGDDSGLVLFCVTVLVLALIVWSLIRWMQHLQTLGSLIDACRQVEEMTEAQFRQRLDTPCLGATPLTGEPPANGVEIHSATTGYIQIIHPEPLQQMAEEKGLELYLLQEIGDFVFVREPLVRITGLKGRPDDETLDTLRRVVCDNVIVGQVRTFDQDPRFGLLTMAQIASKALSPGINDPGTAIDIINRSGRILSVYRDETEGEADPIHPRLHVRPLDAGALIDDAFSAIARDGASFHEVQQRLQKVLSGLMRHPDPELCKAARSQAGDFLKRALDGLNWAPDRDRLRASAEDGLETD